MPIAANMPAPVSEPKMRAVSEVVRAIPIAAVSEAGGTVSAISAPRSPMSDGRTRPVMRRQHKHDRRAAACR